MIDIVLITTGKRPELLEQTLESMRENAEAHHPLVMVFDGPTGILGKTAAATLIVNDKATFITNGRPQGASASRNIGASSIPKYRRNEYVMFLDDDVYMLPGWDKKLELAEKELDQGNTGIVLSGHAHPFNHSLGLYSFDNCAVQAARVLSTVHLFMSWDIWDTVGYFSEPGGPGGSEDVDWCKRAVEKDYGLAVTHPMCVIHCGLTSSSGQKIVGYDLMKGINMALNETYAGGKAVFE